MSKYRRDDAQFRARITALADAGLTLGKPAPKHNGTRAFSCGLLFYGMLAIIFSALILVFGGAH
jgi:hypothetical protein